MNIRKFLLAPAILTLIFSVSISHVHAAITFGGTSINSNSTLSTSSDNWNVTSAGVGTLSSLNLTGLTLGSVPFIGASGAITQDNAELFWDNTNDRLGIGTAVPLGILHINGDGATGTTIIHDIYSTNSAIFTQRAASGTFTSPGAISLNRGIGSYTGRGHDGSSFSADATRIGFWAAENWNPTNHGTYITLEVTPEASTTLTEAVRVTSSGSVGIGTTPAPSAKLDVSGTDGAVLFPRLTTAERDALTAVNGMVIYNTTTDKLQVRAAGVWVDLH